MTNVCVIYPYLSQKATASTAELKRDPNCHVLECVTLCKAIDLNVVHFEAVPLRKIESATILTSGKVEHLQEQLIFHNAELLVLDCLVSPSQQRNLEKKLNIKVLDRVGLILEIFGQRAATREGKLQVEHARLSYQKSRLVKAWSHLERQRGGGGFIGGPGETQKESDRRMIDDAVKNIERQLEQVARTRDLQRKNRQKVPYPIVALAGYTNAGKSTLFNRLTDSEVLEADMLFATLDPTLRTICLKSGDKIILSDTVGFISNLPTQLVKAFRATLEEVIEADVILHIRDIAHVDTEIQKQDVLKVLKELGVSEDIPIVEVFNKIDLVREQADGDAVIDRMLLDNQEKKIETLICSAKKGEGIEGIKLWIQQFLNQDKQTYHLTLLPQQGDVMAFLYQFASITHQEILEDGQIELEISIHPRHYGRMLKQYF